jgi:SAM-dependent methyltransferase
MAGVCLAEHWTQTLYERYPDLYLPILEARREAGALEAEGLSKMLDGAGGQKGKVLDLACGIGRHSIPLAKMGYEVVGYDLSSLFIERARSWAKSQGLGADKLRFYQGDIRKAAEELSAKDETGFDAIISLFSSIGAYGEKEDARMVGDLLGVSSPGCMLVLETLNRDFVTRRFQPFTIQAVTQELRLIDIARFNLQESTIEDDWRFYTELPDGTLRPELVLRISGRVYALHELRDLVTGAGWSYVECFENLVTRAPFGMESPTMVLVSRNGK